MSLTETKDVTTPDGQTRQLREIPRVQNKNDLGDPTLSAGCCAIRRGRAQTKNSSGLGSLCSNRPPSHGGARRRAQPLVGG